MLYTGGCDTGVVINIQEVVIHVMYRNTGVVVIHVKYRRL